MFDKHLNNIYNLDGINGIYQYLLYCHLTYIENPNTHMELTWDKNKNTFSYKNSNILNIECIFNMTRKRYLARKYICIWKQKCIPLKIANKYDLYMNDFESNDTLYLISDRKQFRFTSYELIHIFVSALEYHEDIIPGPKYPKNPYTNRYFNIQECSDIYAFISSRVHKVPDIIQYFYLNHFDMLMFYQMCEPFLNFRACRNHCRDLNLTNKTKHLGLMFKTFEIYDPPSREFIRLYTKNHFDSIETLFTYFLYQFHYNNNVLFIIHIKHYLTVLNREIKILGKSYRKIYKKISI